MALAEIGARLRLQGSAAFRRDADRAADATSRLGKASEKATGGLKSLDRAVSRGLRAGLTGVGGAAKLAGAGLAVAAVAAGALSFKFLNLATDAGETESKFRTVFGAVAADVTRFNNDISNRFGNTTKSLQDATATFGVYGQGANLAGKELVKFSTGLVQAALDLGSFYNASSDEVFSAIQSGLSGEAEPLRRYAIFLSEINLNAFAASKGIKKAVAKMTEQEKVALRGAFIMARLGKAQGDLAKTSSGLANQQRALQGRLEETGTIIGKALLPGATKAATILNARLAPAMTKLRDLAPGMERKFSALVDKVFKFGEAIFAAGRGGGLKGVVLLLDGMTNSGGNLNKRFVEFSRIMREVIIPTGQRMARFLGKAMTVIADHTRLAYIALGVYMARTKLILVATGLYKAYGLVLLLIARRHKQQAAAAVAASATTVLASEAATGAAVLQAAAVGKLRLAYLALGGTPVLLAVGALAAAFVGLAEWTASAERNASNIANLKNGTKTVTTGPSRNVPIPNPGATYGPGNGPLSGKPIVRPVGPGNMGPQGAPLRPQLPASATSNMTGRSMTITPAPVTIMLDRKVVGEGVVEFMRDNAARR